MLAGFKTFIWGTPRVRITGYAVMFNEAVRDFVGDAPYVRIGFGEDGALMGIEGSREEDEYTTPTGSGDKNRGIRIAKSALVWEIKSQMRWDLENYNYSVSGKTYKGIVVFDLTKAKKKRREHYKEI